MKTAIEEDGVEVMGYTPWGCIDLVSASSGEMKKKIWLYYVDLDNQGNGSNNRYPKDSFFWYQKVIEVMVKICKEGVEMKGLKDKVALITGGVSGIGAGIVKKFIEEGCLVYIGDINDERGLEQELLYKHYQAKFVHLNVTDLENWKKVVSQIVEEKGHIDILVNNAGLSQSGASMEEWI